MSINSGFWVLGIGHWLFTLWLGKLSNPDTSNMNYTQLACCEQPKAKGQHPIANELKHPAFQSKYPLT